MAYTYEQFLKAAQDSGYKFSDADMALAKSNPDAGMSLLKYKTDFYNATTDEAKALAHQGAEGIRSSYGGYTGGGDGGSFALLEKSPVQYSAPEAPAYTSRYDDEMQKLINEMLNRDPFSYNPDTDPLNAAYQKAYTREGNRATADALGTAAAASGGIPSSYAVTAATQAGDYYAAQMADKIPELYEIAYNKYLNDYQMQQNNLSALANAEQMDYSKYLNELSQYNTDRSFNYAQLLDTLTHEQNQQKLQIEAAERAAQYGDYSQLEALGINMSNNPVEYEKKISEALMAAQYGDYSKLNAMGIDTSNYSVEQQQALERAVTAAQYGDYSQLKALGINVNLDALNSYAKALSGGLYGKTDDLDGEYYSLTDKEIASLKSMYGGTVLTQKQWDDLLAANKDNGFTEQTLIDAGFTVKGDITPESDPLAWIKKYYSGDTLNSKEVAEIMKKFPDLNTSILEAMGYKLEKTNTKSNDASTSTELGFDMASVMVIGQKLGLGNISEQQLADLINEGIVEEYVSNNQQRFRLADGWERKWQKTQAQPGSNISGTNIIGNQSSLK